MPGKPRLLFCVRLRAGQHTLSQVPKNYKLLAVPLFELYDNLLRYGPVLASIPTMVSRYRLTLGAAVAVARAVPETQQADLIQQQALQGGQMVNYPQY